MITKDGKVVKTVMRSFSLNEISAVDRPAQANATVSIMKRDEPKLTKLDATMALTTMTGGHSHLITMGGGDFQRRAGDTSYVDGHSHPWLMDEAGNIQVGYALGHSHGIEVISKSVMTEEQIKRLLQSPAGGPVTRKNDETNPTGDAEAIGNNEDQSMTPEEKQAAEAAAAQKTAELEKMTKRAERAEKVAGLSDQHRNHFRVLKGEDAEQFLAATDGERDATIRKAQEANQVVYTAEDGTEYRKSDDPRMINLAKALDSEKKKRQAADAAACKADLEKRASELEHIPGDLNARVALLKGIDTLPEAERKTALEALKAQNTRLSGAFKSVGTSAAPATDDVQDELDRMASDIAKRDNITFQAAYAKALETPAGQKLYETHVNKRAGVGV